MSRAQTSPEGHRKSAIGTISTAMQLPLPISLNDFKKCLRSGPQQFRASALRELTDGVLLNGRDFDFEAIKDRWRFIHSRPTGESDWISTETIYALLKASGRIAEPSTASGRTPDSSRPSRKSKTGASSRKKPALKDPRFRRQGGKGKTVPGKRRPPKGRK